MFLTDDGLSGSPAEVLATLLHEAAHAIAERRQIKDTSRQGSYHNARFRAVAEEVGLEVRRDPVIGWSPTVLTSATAAGYRATLRELAEALAYHQPNQSAGACLDGGFWECACGRWVGEHRRRASKPRAAMCGICGGPLRSGNEPTMVHGAV